MGQGVVALHPPHPQPERSLSHQSRPERGRARHQPLAVGDRRVQRGEVRAGTQPRGPPAGQGHAEQLRGHRTPRRTPEDDEVGRLGEHGEVGGPPPPPQPSQVLAHPDGQVVQRHRHIDTDHPERRHQGRQQPGVVGIGGVAHPHAVGIAAQPGQPAAHGRLPPVVVPHRRPCQLAQGRAHHVRDRHRPERDLDHRARMGA